jgi:hypothetical protein
MVTTIKERPMTKTRRRPGYKELPELFDMFGGNLHKVADYTGYGVRQVNYWITEAPEAVKIGLMEHLAKARARQKQAIDLRPELPGFIIPSEIKPLVSLYYRLPFEELLLLDIEDMLLAMDSDPDKPPTLRYKMEWQDLKDAILDLEHTFQYTRPSRPNSPADEPKTLGGPVTIGGVTYEWWHEYVLMSWVGLNALAPLLERHEYPPEVMQDVGKDPETGLMKREVIPHYLEKTIRLLIKRLGRYL